VYLNYKADLIFTIQLMPHYADMYETSMHSTRN